MLHISIIVPVYNSAQYIERCFLSLIHQTLDDIEIIFVDDHGIDDSIAILHDLIRQYDGKKIIRMLSTERNSGPGVARNLGLENANGEYVAFVDSDDAISPDFGEMLYTAIKVHDADLCLCNLTRLYPNGDRIDGVNPPVVSGMFIGRNKKKYLYQYTSFFTTYLYKRELIKNYNIVFPSTHCAEDSCFLGCCLLAAERIAAIDRSLYFYHINSVSVSQKKDGKRGKARLASFSILRRFAKRNGFYCPYIFSIENLIFRKGYILAFQDWLKSLR